MTERRELKISVRNLVEFIFREGDINSTGLGTRNPEAMQLGNKIHKKIQKSIDLIRNCMCNLCKLLLYFTTCGSFCIGAGICQSFAAVDEKNTYGDTSESESMQCSYGGCKPRCAGVFFILYRIFVHQPARRIYPSSSRAGGSFVASLPRRLWFHRQSACAVKGNQLPVAGGENE